jgi:radical SAM protein with 4Fe4S-binding SPASM domain
MWQRPADSPQELDWPEWRPIMEELAAAGIRKVELFGGDALLRKDLLVNMVRFCREHDIYSFFPTNSIALTKQTATELVEAGLNVIYLSFDELPEIDGAIRGTKRHFDKVLRSVEWLRAARGPGSFPRIECITTVSAGNWRHLPELLAASRDGGADAHHIWAMSEFTPAVVAASPVAGVRPNPYFMSTDGSSHRLSHDEAADLWRMLRQIRADASRYEPMSVKMETMEHLDSDVLASLRYPRQKCGACATVVVLSPHGNVMPCPYFGDYVLGNLRDGKLGDCWGSEAHRQFAHEQQEDKLPICRQCSLKFVHRPFAATVRDEARRLRARLG